MSKELIRNGGFERGNTDFWEIIDVTSMEALAAAKKYGVYGCKVISSGQAYGYLQSKDLIEVEPLQVLSLSAWIQNSVSRAVSFLVREYDPDGDQISANMLQAVTISTAYTRMKENYVISEEASYAKACIAQHSFAAADYSYIDSVSAKLMEMEKLAVYHDFLISVVNETTKHTVNDSEFFTGLWKHAEYFLDVTSFTETGGLNPVTLDVKIETYDPNIAKWRDAMVFQQLSCPASGSETTQEYKGLESNLGWKQRVTYTTGGAGTIGDCDFKVGVVYKR